MTVEQLIAQWNASIETVQQHPDLQTPQADLPRPDSAIQVRTNLSAGAENRYGEPCTFSMTEEPGCY
jgi:hypothetical protein